jgi:hypothetical protein
MLLLLIQVFSDVTFVTLSDSDDSDNMMIQNIRN